MSLENVIPNHFTRMPKEALIFRENVTSICTPPEHWSKWNTMKQTICYSWKGAGKGTAGKGYNWNGFRKIEKFAGNRQKITFLHRCSQTSLKVFLDINTCQHSNPLKKITCLKWHHDNLSKVILNGFRYQLFLTSTRDKKSRNFF